MDKISEVLNLEPTPNDMPKSAKPWIEGAKDQLREHFSSRFSSLPVYDRAVVL